MADEPKPPARKPPTVAPTVPPTIPPTVAPTVAPILKPIAAPAPVVKPIAAPAPVVAPVSAPTRAPAPVVAPVKAAEPEAPAPGSVTTQHRASDRIASYTGAPTALLLSFLLVVLGAVGGGVAYAMARVPASSTIEAADGLGVAAARVLAQMEPDWWDPKHGTAGEMRAHAVRMLEKEELTVKALPEGPERDRLKADLALAREKFLGMLLPDRRGEDDMLEARNRERFRKLAFEGAILGVGLYDPTQRPTIGAMPSPGVMEKDGVVLKGSIKLADKSGREVRGRLYIAPITGRQLDPTTHEPIGGGFAGVALSVEPALAIVEAAEQRAMIAGGSVLGAGLLAALLCWAFLAPLRRVQIGRASCRDRV